MTQWVKRNNGNSGDGIRFDHVNGNVMKTSTNERLLIQARRQREMYDLFKGDGCFGFSKVIDSGKKDRDFFFVMKLIDGYTAIPIITDGEESIIREFAQQISKILHRLGSFDNVNPYEQPPEGISLHSSVMLKVTNNCNKLSALGGIKNEEEIVRLFEDKLAGIDNATHNRKTLYLGDCTLDNMIVDGGMSSNGIMPIKDNKIIFLDLLDLQYPHFRQDIAKLHQDIDASFFEIKYNNKITQRKKDIFKEVFLEELKRHNPAYIPYHYVLVAYSLMRILPYLPDREKYDKLYAEMMDLLKKGDGSYGS